MFCVCPSDMIPVSEADEWNYSEIASKMSVALNPCCLYIT